MKFEILLLTLKCESHYFIKYNAKVIDKRAQINN